MNVRIRRRGLAFGGICSESSAARRPTPSQLSSVLFLFFVATLVLHLVLSPIGVRAAAWTGTAAYRRRNQAAAVRPSRRSLAMSSSAPASSLTMSTSQRARTKKKVAIIGGGVAGLSCAGRLTSQPERFDVTVFDTGRVRPGGRASSRQPRDKPKDDASDQYPILSKFRYDHAAQVVAVDFVRFPEFSRHVLEHWVPAGILRPFPPLSLFTIESSKARRDMQCSVPNEGDSGGEVVVPAYYYAPRGMGSLITDGMVAASAGRYHLRQDVWISPSNGARFQSNRNRKEGGVSPSTSTTRQWTLQAKGRVQGRFDEIVIAHNGKCADRLMSTSPAKRVHELLRVNFGSTAPPLSKKMVLNSLYSWTFCLPKETSVLSRALNGGDGGGGDGGAEDNPDSLFRCGFVENCNNIRFLTCQSNKLDQDGDNNGRETELYEVWTVLSSPHFAKAHKAPQESLGPDVTRNVTTLLGASLESYLELSPGSVTNAIGEQRLQLWGAGVPLNTLQNQNCGFVYDSTYGVGVCGDWLVDPSLAGAWTSGYRLADHLLSSNDPPTRGLEETGPTFARCAAATEAGIASLTSPSKATSPSSRSNTATRRPFPRSTPSPSGQRARERAASQ